MKNYTTLTDEALIEEVHRLARSVSYYNAAEGNWSRETAEREACQAEFRECMREFKSRGLEFENKGYLL
jgi:hypothetical protein